MGAARAAGGRREPGGLTPRPLRPARPGQGLTGGGRCDRSAWPVARTGDRGRATRHRRGIGHGSPMPGTPEISPRGPEGDTGPPVTHQRAPADRRTGQLRDGTVWMEPPGYTQAPGPQAPAPHQGSTRRASSPSAGVDFLTEVTSGASTPGEGHEQPSPSTAGCSEYETRGPQRALLVPGDFDHRTRRPLAGGEIPPTWAPADRLVSWRGGLTMQYMTQRAAAGSSAREDAATWCPVSSWPGRTRRAGAERRSSNMTLDLHLRQASSGSGGRAGR